MRVTAERDADTVVVTFADTGPGLAHPERVFEPFFTTKGVGEGTGLGLALVHRFMDGFGGGVRAQNGPDGGARIILTFVADEEAEAAPVGAVMTTDGDRGPTSTVRVLVVEDEAPLRDLQRRLLARIDADVLVASAGREAIDVLEEQDVDLVVSDVKMPDGSGLELFRWVEQNRPGLAERFLFVTGDIGDPEIASIAKAEPHRFVRKPFQMKEYLESVSAALG